MRRLICICCGTGEDLNDPSGNIHTIRVSDLTSPYDENGGPDKPIEEDLCARCRTELRQKFFGEPQPETLNMPLMKTA